MSSAAVLRLLLSVLLGLASSAAGRLAAVIKTYENDTILLPCHVEDLGVEPRVRWWKKVEENGTVTNRLLADSGEPLAVMASPRMRMWGNRSLELHVRPEDSGKYVCQAQRPEPWGHVTQVHEIQVIYPPSVKTVPENGLLEVTMGEEAELACETEGTPKPVVTWKFEGKELAVGKRLLVHAANRSLAGLYTCRASNGIGNPARASIELRIKHKPEVSAGRRWVHSAPGIRAQLECLVVSWPEGRFEWFFKGKPLGRSAHVLRQKQDEPGTGKTGVGPPAQLHSLILGSLEPEDFGVYTCKASNELGEAETNVELSGSPRQPKLRKGPTGYNFIWEVDSYSPIFEYQFWFRQMRSEEDWRRLTVPSSNEPAGPLHAHSFNLTGLEPSGQYEALVLARNRFGWSSPSNVVKFSNIPDGADEETYDVDNNNDDGVEKEPSVVQVTSDFHRSSVDANSSGHPELNCLALLLSLLLLLT